MVVIGTFVLALVRLRAFPDRRRRRRSGGESQRPRLGVRLLLGIAGSADGRAAASFAVALLKLRNLALTAVLSLGAAGAFPLPARGLTTTPLRRSLCWP